jgi:hypothetical protein
MVKAIILKVAKIKYGGNDVWVEIYNALIKARKGDSASVGVFEVID